MSEPLYWIWLSRAIEPGSRAGKILLEKYSSPEEIFEAEEHELKKLNAISPKELKSLASKDLARANSTLAYCIEKGVSLLTYHDLAYPNALKEIDNPPILLYYRGTLPDWNKRPSVAMVGTRAMSQYGASVCLDIAYDAANMGIIVVSGMALGIDGIASASALAAGGATVAVLGCGIDRIYPEEHTVLYNSIVHGGGVVLTEYAPHEGPNGFHFPIRNRIISGLSRGVIVFDGDAGSGAMITANHAKKQGRDVFAVPGRIDDAWAEGPLLLLKSGARVITCADDLYDLYREEYLPYINGFRLLEERTIDLFDLTELYGLSVGGPRMKSSVGTRAKTRKRDKARRKTEGSGLMDRLFSAASSIIAPKEKNAPLPVSELPPPNDDRPTLGVQETAIMACFPERRDVHPDEIKVEGMSVNDIISCLTMMEIEGWIISTAGGKFRKL